MSAIQRLTCEDAFQAIHEPTCAAAVWQRALPQDLQSWLETLQADELPKGRIVLAKADIEPAIRSLCETPLQIDPVRTEHLIKDASKLADQFAKTMKADFLRIRLDVVKTNACRKFHKDFVKARLVCTYRGTGTQFGISTNGEDPTEITTVKDGSPLILRGHDWPEVPVSGLLHRSPPIEGSGETRLLFVVDVVDSLDADSRH